MNARPALTIVVEGQSDAAILRSILDHTFSAGMRYYSAAGRVSPVTVGRNLLVHENNPVLVVVDSDTLDQRQSADIASMAGALLGAVAPETRFAVFAFVPEFEAIFFEAPAAVETLVGAPVSQETVREGLLTPRRTLEKLLAGGKSKLHYQILPSRLDTTSVSRLREGRQMKSLVETVERMLHEEPVHEADK